MFGLKKKEKLFDKGSDGREFCVSNLRCFEDGEIKTECEIRHQMGDVIAKSTLEVAGSVEARYYNCKELGGAFDVVILQFEDGSEIMITEEFMNSLAMKSLNYQNPIRISSDGLRTPPKTFIENNRGDYCLFYDFYPATEINYGNATSVEVSKLFVDAKVNSSSMEEFKLFLDGEEPDIVLNA